MANIEESVGATDSVGTDYRYEQNIHSDSRLLQESVAEAEIIEDRVTLITDGGYGGGHLPEKCYYMKSEKQITIILAAEHRKGLVMIASSVSSVCYIVL